MKIIIHGTVEDVETYESAKNGFGATVTVSALEDKKRKSLTFNTRDTLQASVLNQKLQEEVVLEIELIQNNFGLRFGEIISVN